MYQLHPDDVLLYRGASPRTGRISPFDPSDGIRNRQAPGHHHDPTPQVSESRATAHSSYSRYPQCTGSDLKVTQNLAAIETPIRCPRDWDDNYDVRSSLNNSICSQRLSYDLQLDRLSLPGTGIIHIPGAWDDDSDMSPLSDSAGTYHNYCDSRLAEVLPPVQAFVHPSKFSNLKEPRRASGFRRLLRRFTYRSITAKSKGEGVWLRAALDR